MTWITIDEARENLKMWLAAEKEICAGGQSYTIGSRSLSRVNLAEIAERITYWRGVVANLENGNNSRRRVWRAVPRDL